MNIPKKFTLAGDEWTVGYKWGLILRKEAHDGITNYDKKTILIDRAITQEEKESTFFHEWLHAVLDTHGVGFNQVGTQEAYDREEAIILAIEKEIFKAFKLRWIGE